MFIVYVFRNDELITRADCHDMKHAIGMMKENIGKERRHSRNCRYCCKADRS